MLLAPTELLYNPRKTITVVAMGDMALAVDGGEGIGVIAEELVVLAVINAVMLAI